MVCRRFEKGVQLAIEVPCVGPRPASVVLARVAHVKRLPEGQWLLGCSFASEMSPEEVETLLLDPPGKEGRGETVSKEEEPQTHAVYVVPRVLFQWAEAEEVVLVPRLPFDRDVALARRHGPQGASQVVGRQRTGGAATRGAL